MCICCYVSSAVSVKVSIYKQKTSVVNTVIMLLFVVTSAVQSVLRSVYTELFISPSGISNPCSTVAGMVTPKGSMSTEGETLQVSVLPYRCSIC